MPHIFRRYPTWWLGILPIFASLSCDGKPPTEPIGPLTLTIERATIAAAGDTVALRARVEDRRARSVSGANVAWSLEFSDGTPAPGLGLPTSMSDASGVAHNVFVVGDTAQDYRVIASTAGARDSQPALFDPVSLSVNVGSNQIALGDTVEVRLLAEDARGNVLPVPRASVSPVGNALPIDGSRFVVVGGPQAHINVACCGRVIGHTMTVGTRVRVRATTLDERGTIVRIAFDGATFTDTISMATDTTTTVWTSRFLQGGTFKLRAFDPDTSSTGLHPSEISLSAFSHVATLKPLLVPRTWTVRRGSYAGRQTPIDLLKMFNGGVARVSALPYLGQNGSPIVRPKEAFPVKVTIDTGLFTLVPTPYLPSDSVALGLLIDKFNERIGFTAFRIVSRADVAIDSVLRANGLYGKFWPGGALVIRDGSEGNYSWWVETPCMTSSNSGLPCPNGGVLRFASVRSSFTIPNPSESSDATRFEQWFLRFLGMGRSCYEESVLFNPGDCAAYAAPDFPFILGSGAPSVAASPADIAQYEMLEMLGETFPLVSPTWSMAATVRTAWIDRFGALPTGRTFYPSP